ncbi:RNA polymerase, alpha subunit [Corchorus olitorius]|uniref:DNA-directed RNA polymerase subunit n=1 Tax=Corchorus olitorius TaxID=93759 RepID=A0A1R3JQQ1_9ROSI|nr:RNA polymerase, alpha subunit [Corchorus olitorius]
MQPQNSPGILCTKQPYIDDVGPRKIKSVKFSTLSDSDIAKVAELHLDSEKCYDSDGSPVEGGLLDRRMGPTRKGSSCATCGAQFVQCPGHFGYLNLALPVFNVGYLSTILDILKCICKSCSRILLDEELYDHYLGKMRQATGPLNKCMTMKTVVKKCTRGQAMKCRRCGFINGAVKKAPMMLAIIHDRSKINDDSMEELRSAISHTRESKASFNIATYVLNPVNVLSLFKRMTDVDCELLYLSDRPEKFIVTNIAVPPVAIRNSVINDGSSTEDDITMRLRQIIWANFSLRKELVETNANLRCLSEWEMLQVEVAQYINSDVRGVPIGTQLSKPLTGFVQRLKGKKGRFRNNLSAKRVEYTGRTVISPDPNLKITEVAIPIHMARTLTYPERVSAHNIEKLRQCVLNGNSKYPGASEVIINNERWILKDYAKRKRFADELQFGSIVRRHLEDGDVVLFNRQPSLHKMSFMCHRARIMPWRTLRFNESVCNPYNADFDGDEMNIHVPQTEEARAEALMLMGVQTNLCTPKNGEILVASTQDFLTSSFLITRKDTFYDRAAFSLICCYMGDGMDHIDLPAPSIVKPIELWTGKQLFSVLLRPNAGVRVFLNLMVKERNFSKEIVKTVGDKEIEVETMCPNDGFVYFRNSELISGQLGKATLGNGNKDGLYSVLLRDYNAHAAAACMNRLAKLSARWIGNHGFSIGIDDVQPGKSLTDEKAATISADYRKCDVEIQMFSEGKLQLKPGLDAAETLEANITDILNKIRDKIGKAVGGRRIPNGFIDRSLPHFLRGSKAPTVKVSETGYLSRKMMKSMEDLTVHYDKTVRNASGCIVQFIYGDDGMDPACMEGKSGFALNFERLLLKVKAICPPVGQKYLPASDIPQMLEEQLSTLDPASVCSESFKKSLKVFLERLANEMNRVERLVENCKQKDGIPKKCITLDVDKIVCHKISGITERQLEIFVRTCISRYQSKLIEPGTAAGAIAAHSIGEPGTQMTLKTFHFAGVASMNITGGVPRIREIINATKNISTPIITAELEFVNNLNIARMVKGRIEKTVLGQVAESIEIEMTSRSASVIVTLDMERIQDAQLYIDANVVKESILQTPKIKLKDEHVKVLGVRKLEVVPPADRSKFHFNVHFLKNLLPLVVVKGIKTVERAVIAEKKNEEKNQKEQETGKQYHLLVEGLGLKAVIGIEGINGRKTISNHVMEMEQVLGIEAARTCIINELAQTMASHGISVDIRHLMLVADVMTFRGQVLGNTIQGSQKMGKSALMLASFERPTDHLFSAAVNGREDTIEGVSDCIIMGVPVHIGTGMLKIIQRVDPLPLLRYGPDPALH